MISGSVAAISQSLQLRPTSIFRFVVSTLGIATIAGVYKAGAGSPVLELGTWWTFFTDVPATGLSAAQAWLTQREEFFSGVSWLVLIVVAVVLATGGFRAVNTLAGPTLVLAIVLGSSLGIFMLWQLGVAGAVCIATFIARRFFNGSDELASDHVGGVLIAVMMAFAYAPVLLFQWLTAESGSEQDQLKRRQVEALERIASDVPHKGVATGAFAANAGSIRRPS